MSDADDEAAWQQWVRDGDDAALRRALLPDLTDEELQIRQQATMLTVQTELYLSQQPPREA